MSEQSAEAYGFKIDEEISRIFRDWRKTHNQGVFDAYTPEMRAARKSGVITGLPDAYGRGRIIGDYRRVALYGVDFLMKDKYAQFSSLQKDLEDGVNLEATIRLREEIAEQHRALGQMNKWQQATVTIFLTLQRTLAKLYNGYTSAIFSAIKTQNGAAMSVGRISTFLDIYINRDLQEGTLTETKHKN